MSFFDFFCGFLFHNVDDVMAQRLNNSHPVCATGDCAGEPRYFSAQVSQAQRFFLDLNPAPGADLVTVSGGCEHCRSDYEINRPCFSHSIVEFVARGAGQLWLNDQKFELLPGTVFVYGPDMPHRIISDKRDLMVKYFCVFAGDAGRQMFDQCQIGFGRVVRVAYPEQIQRVFDDLIFHGRGDNPNRARMCNVALQYLIMEIGDVALPQGETATRAFATYQQCRRYIEENFARVRSLREVAEACHLDLAYLCRLFQRFGRERPNRYLQHLRLNYAAELLQNSERPVKDVAAELGYSDPFNFSRAFHQAFGMPPGRARQFGRKGDEA
jgi:AraC-like DNA-binding protein